MGRSGSSLCCQQCWVFGVTLTGPVLVPQMLAVPQDQPHAVNDSIPEGYLVKVDILGKAACP